MALRTLSEELRDLADGSPPLTEPETDRPYGVRLRAWIGAGGMAAVFRAERDDDVEGGPFGPGTPEQLAIKILLPRVAREAAALNLTPASLFLREREALERLMANLPPSEFVVGYHGAGMCTILDPVGLTTVPWLALEYVPLDQQGATLRHRVTSAGGGLHPERALRLARGLLEGTKALHAAGILHRDLKPDNVLVLGPVDDETPKIADYGIARVADSGLSGTIGAATPEYAAPEQLLHRLGQKNPLVGPWTDVHALAAVLWFILAGEDPCRGRRNRAWLLGERRSLATAARVHEGLLLDPRLFDELDAILGRGLAPRPPRVALEPPEAAPYMGDAKRFLPRMLGGEERLASVDELAAPFLETLSAIARAWERRCVAARLPSTILRTRDLAVAAREPSDFVLAEEHPLRRGARRDRVEADLAAFRHDGSALARFGEELYFLGAPGPLAVAVPSGLQDTPRKARAILRGPTQGFSLITPEQLLLLAHGQVTVVAPPQHPDGGHVGPIQAAAASPGVLAIVTAETDDERGGPELWLCRDGATWSEPRLLPLGGEVRALARGPYGWLVVGGRKNKARALFLPDQGAAQVLVEGVHGHSPLGRALVTEDDQWFAAGAGFVLALRDSPARVEPLEDASAAESPVAMELDRRGDPWLVTTHAAYRRRDDGDDGARWQLVCRRPASRPPFVAFSSLAGDPRILDAEGTLVLLRSETQELAPASA